MVNLRAHLFNRCITWERIFRKGYEIEPLTLMLLVANLANTKGCKNLKNDWNLGIWVLIWEYSSRAIPWIPTWQGLDGFQRLLRPCALDESSLSIGRVKRGSHSHIHDSLSVLASSVLQTWALLTFLSVTLHVRLLFGVFTSVSGFHAVCACVLWGHEELSWMVVVDLWKVLIWLWFQNLVYMYSLSRSFACCIVLNRLGAFPL